MRYLIALLLLVLTPTAIPQTGVVCSGNYCGFISGPTLLYRQGIACPIWWNVSVSAYVPSNATEIHVKAAPILANSDQWGNVDAVLIIKLDGQAGQYTEVIAAGQGYAANKNGAVDRSELIIIPGKAFDWCLSGNTLNVGANVTFKLIGYRVP